MNGYIHLISSNLEGSSSSLNLQNFPYLKHVDAGRLLLLGIINNFKIFSSTYEAMTRKCSYDLLA